MKKGTECNLQLQGFKLASCYCRNEQRRGGSCILIKNNIDYSPLLIANQLACCYNFECCGIEIPSYNLIIVCIYRIPKSNIKIFFDKLSLLLNKVTKNNKKHIIICGDWNIDILSDNSQTKELKAILLNHNLHPHINKPTRKTTSIDQIATNFEESDVKADIHHLALSDHDTGQTLLFPVTTRNTDRKPINYCFENRRDYCKENIIKFCNILSSLSFSEVYEENECEKSFDIFHDLLKLFYDLCFPLLRVKIGKKVTKNKWITKGLKKSCVKKRLLYYKYQHEAINKQINQKNYLNYTKILKRCIQKSQKINNNKYILNSKSKCRASWNIIKNNISLIKDKNYIDKIKNNDITYNKPNDISNLFNDFFINLKTHGNNVNISNAKDNKYNKYITNTTNSMFIKPIDEFEIIKIIKTLNNTNSAGYDEINTKIIKNCADIIASPLTYILNKSFEQGTFPSRLKISIVKPIYKKGDPTEMGNYRPITLIPVISKIFEKAMSDRMESFLTKNNILAENQFGFRRGRSTTQACFSLVKEITESLDKKQMVMGLFLDMTKAFDYVSHSRLLYKLQKYGIRGKAYQWIQSYLSKRYQLTEICNIIKNTKITFKSSTKINGSGVPQGSILGPLLFLLYINDIPKVLKQESILFADDITLIIKSKNKNELEISANEELKTIIEWLEYNNLKINLKKTNTIHFRSYNQTDTLVNINHNNTMIDQVSSTKFLGLTMDVHLNWKEHVDNVCAKLDKFVFALRRLRLVASLDTALSAYHGYVSSVLRYGLIIWGHSVDAERALRVQKKCMRAICGADYLDHCKPLFKRLKILPLPCQYILDICTFVKKHPQFFPLNDTVLGKSNSRDPYKLNVPKQRLKIYSKNVNGNAIGIYNKLPIKIRELSLSKFKHVLYNWLLQECFYSLKEFIDIKLKIDNFDL